MKQVTSRTLLVMAFAVALGSSVSEAKTPGEGVPLSVRRGFFTETDIGGFFTLGGAPGYSNLQTYLQLGLGYQFTINNGSGLLPIGLHVAIGANSQNCFATYNDAARTCRSGTGGMAASVSDNFTLTFFSVSAGYLHRVIERLYVGGKLLGGVTLLDPTPFALPSSGNPINLGGNFGVAASIEYATNLDHLSIGFDIGYRLVIGGPSAISALMFYPRVQYTF
jgi:hypothetical protein